MLEKSKLAEDLMEVIGHLAGSVRGGLGIGIVLVGVLLGATTGIVGATVVTLGLLTLPGMLKRGYDKGLACGVICASGTLGQIIPPSLILILLADILNESVGTLVRGRDDPRSAARRDLCRLHPYPRHRPSRHGAGLLQGRARPRLEKRAHRQDIQGGGAARRAGRRGARLDHCRHRGAVRSRVHGRARIDRGRGGRRPPDLEGAARDRAGHHQDHRDDDVHPDLRAGFCARVPRAAGREDRSRSLRVPARAASTRTSGS